MNFKLWYLWVFLISTLKAGATEYQQIPYLWEAYRSPKPANVEKAKSELIKVFGLYPGHKSTSADIISSNFFQFSWKGFTKEIQLHALVIKNLNQIRKSILACKSTVNIASGKDPILNADQLGIVIELNKVNQCLEKLLTNHGFFQLAPSTFVMIGIPILPALECPADMVHINDYCIDRFEAPSIAGVKPLVATKATEAMAFCQMQGKQLCSDMMWENACTGNGAKLPYPYGNQYRQGICNDDKKWKPVKWGQVARYHPATPSKYPQATAHIQWLNQSEPSGARSKCKSQQGVYDLTGNAAEWVLNTKQKPSSQDGTVYQVVMKGCYWSKCYKGINPSCAFTNPNHGRFFRSYEAGFRCCTQL